MGKKKRASKTAAKATSGTKRRKPSTGTARKARAKSTTPAKRTAARRSAPSSPAPEPPPKKKSPLSEQELAEFREMLLSKRAELIGDVRQLTDTALHGSEPGGIGSLSNMPIHPADVGSDNWEQEFTIDLIDNERQLLKDIDAALSRMKEGGYGICEATGKPISKKRLRAKPWARYCIEYARKKEQGLLP